MARRCNHLPDLRSTISAVAAIRNLQRFVEVPSSWEGWVMRVMTVSVVLMITTTLVLLQMVIGLRAYVSDSFADRRAFQEQEAARQCLILTRLGASDLELRGHLC